VDDPEPGVQDASRRTRLAAERTWLAWWRTGLATTGAAIAIGRLLPELTHVSHVWAYRALGLAYGVLAIAILLIGGVRQRRGAQALDRGGYDELSLPLVSWLTAVAVVLGVGTLLIIALAA
jgi:putative membrane protein